MKDLLWSRLNPTLYSLCFAGKAKRHVACNFCLSDNHTPDQCPDNPPRYLYPGSNPCLCWELQFCQPRNSVYVIFLTQEMDHVARIGSASSHTSALCVRGHTLGPLARGGPMRVRTKRNKLQASTAGVAQDILNLQDYWI